jgi:hypothetical protein
MTPDAFVVHELPYRIRFQIPSRRGDIPYFESAMQRMYDCADILAFSANPRTGSIVVRHSGDAAAVADFAARHGLFETRREDVSAPDHIGAEDRRSVRVSATTVALSTLALYQARRGRVAGSSAEALWTAYQASITLKRPWVAAAYTAVGVYRLLTGPVLAPALTLAFYAASMHPADQDSAGSA